MVDEHSVDVLAELLQAAEAFAREGGDSTLDYFKKSFDLEFKSDHSPVTNADRKVERIIRDAIQKKFPGHGIIGEEYGAEEDNMGRDVVWVIDPIDGTQSFIHGVPFYTTLVGVLVNGLPRVGVIYAPALNELVAAASGMGARLNGEPCQTRPCNELAKATFLTTDIGNIRKQGLLKPYEELLGKTRIHRTWGDAFGHMMVALGRADIMFDPVLSIWDAAALLPVVTEAGGWFSDIKGEQTIESGNALSCSDGLKDAVLKTFNENRSE